MHWIAFDNGASLGQRGSEDGIIIRDEEHPYGARITLEGECMTSPFTITCGIYGWMVHTRFFRGQHEAEEDLEKMKEGLTNILNIIPFESDLDVEEKMNTVSDTISAFVEQYP
jgi:hypothetical protein